MSPKITAKTDSFICLLLYKSVSQVAVVYPENAEMASLKHKLISRPSALFFARGCDSETLNGGAILVPLGGRRRALMETLWLTGAAFIAASLILGGRFGGLSAPSVRRTVLASLGGSGVTLGMIALRVSWLSIVTLPMATVICYAPQGAHKALRAGIMTLMASFLAGGCGVCALGATGSAWLSALIALAGCAVTVPLTKLLPTEAMSIKQIELQMGQRQVLLPAMIDTGNLLRDPISGDPVVVVSARAIRPLFPDAKSLSDPNRLPQGFRLMRVRTAAGCALMPLFRPTKCHVFRNGHSAPARALVAVAPGEYRGVQALVPAALSIRWEGKR